MLLFYAAADLKKLQNIGSSLVQIAVYCIMTWYKANFTHVRLSAIMQQLSSLHQRAYVPIQNQNSIRLYYYYV